MSAAEPIRLGFIGAGQMAEAIIAGLLDSGAYAGGDICIFDTSPQRLDYMQTHYGIATANSAAAVLQRCKMTLLCVKPQFAADALASCGGIQSGTQVISIMGGMPVERVAALLPDASVVRVMPNTSVRVRSGSCGICAAATTNAEHLKAAKALFALLGGVYEIPESLMDAFTGISGCGPAFAYLFMEALADGAVQQGLGREMARSLAAQTLLGAAQMALESGEHTAQLRDNVCSPGGGTIAGVRALEDAGLRSAVMSAVEKSTQRMQELGNRK